MKKILFVFLLTSLFGISVLSACSSSDSEPVSEDMITVTPELISIQGVGGQSEISVSANHEWGTIISDSWIKIDKLGASKGTSKVVVSADANPKTSPREGSITFMAGKARKTITVNQLAGDNDINDSYNAPEGYDLVWNDEFNSGYTLGSSWTHEVQGPGWVNNELQYYVNGEIDGNRVTEINDGKLKIHCFKHNNKIYSGRVYANVNTGWKYGYFEAKIKLPKGKGTWPAFWMMPCNNNYNTNPWPGCGEIDIMEEVGVDAGHVSSTIHCNKYNNTNTSIEHASKYLATAESDFHIYSLEWTPTNMRFYVDRELILDYANDGTGKNAWPFDNNFYVILNLAWGGDWGGYKGVDDNALPVTMEVDYVRVFQKK